jgi:hypothetical protein
MTSNKKLEYLLRYGTITEEVVPAPGVGVHNLPPLSGPKHYKWVNNDLNPYITVVEVKQTTTDITTFISSVFSLIVHNGLLPTVG